ncbi:hypothetical protein KVF89_26135 [Nocardioides carbamazepini]|uniref:hypothetical protein n=1 Tax=Nocardioides carbamazepini TaxID=2854259 RepID=UPI002149CBEF|nr:hypothetical protein [Nocardioides carbamazepini]MCR1786041.1 hypothetical protein [Nocardioides carbamazepini]
MRTTLSEPPYRWVEEGECGPFRARLELAFAPDPVAAATSRVTAEFAVRGLGLGPVLTRGSRPAVAADLRRAARALLRD